MSSIGVMTMPVDFPYRDVFLKGKPQHDRFDLFSARHPKMPLGRRAKIFAPFDALKGFSEAIGSKDVLYEERKVLNDEKQQKLEQQLHVLKTLTSNSHAARENHVIITVVHYVPCADENNEAFGSRGNYRTITGVCRNVDEIYGTILIDNCRIAFEDILNIDYNDAERG